MPSIDKVIIHTLTIYNIGYKIFVVYLNILQTLSFVGFKVADRLETFPLTFIYFYYACRPSIGIKNSKRNVYYYLQRTI